jgi:hypothetical protein
MSDNIVVNISKQNLLLYLKGRLIKKYPISTSIRGVGSKENSEKTPLGRHRIIEKIGKDAPRAMMFENKVSLNKTSRIYNKKPDALEDDHIITSRILVLEGLEDGLNRGEGIDSKKRCIYIHGTPFEYDIGRPASHGCIRMKNDDIIELFDLIEEDIEVEIRKK